MNHLLQASLGALVPGGRGCRAGTYAYPEWQARRSSRYLDQERVKPARLDSTRNLGLKT